jgi:hypothetical protein
MIITLKGANFSLSNIGTLSTWRIITYLGAGASSSNSATSVDKESNTGYSTTITIAEGYEIGSAGVTVTMGGNPVAVDTSTNPFTINIPTKVTGKVVINVPTKNTATGEEEEPDIGGNEDEIVTYNFPLRPTGVGVSNSGTGRVSDADSRLSNGSADEKLGILVPAGGSITLKGLASGTYPLRFDYVCSTQNVVNPASGSTTAIAGLVGTASNYDSNNYFPLNTDGKDICKVVNTHGQDCYFWFVFCGLTKSEKIAAEIDTYNITYTISLVDDGWTILPTTRYAMGVSATGTGRVTPNNTKRFSTADDTTENGILIPSGKTMHLKGLASGTYPLRLDYMYCTSNATCPVNGSTTAIAGLVGTASNYDSNNYFPLNKTGGDTIDITNNYGGDYYFWFGFAGQTLNEEILNAYSTYNLVYKID